MKKKVKSKTSQTTIIAIMTALALILNRVVPSLPYIHITLDFLPIFIVGYLYGPLWSGLAYGLADTIGSILIPFGPYNPIITMSMIVTGIVLGFAYHRRELNGSKIIYITLITSVVMFIIKIFITTFGLWLFTSADNTYFALLIARIPSCAVISIAVCITIPLLYKTFLKSFNHITI